MVWMKRQLYLQAMVSQRQFGTPQLELWQLHWGALGSFEPQFQQIKKAAIISLDRIDSGSSFEEALSRRV